MARFNTISEHVIQFCRFLRNHDFNIGPLEQSHALEALAVLPFEKETNFKNALSLTLVNTKRELDLFEDLYYQYWNEVKKSDNSKLKDVPEEKLKKPTPKAPSIHVIKNWLHGNRESEEIEMAQHSTNEAFSEQDFSRYRNDDLKETLLYTNQLVRKLSNKKGRRFISSNQRKELNMRKVIRSNITKTDEIIHLSYKKKKIEKLRLVVIADVSRSMELYSKFLIQFMYGLNQASTQVETFVFSTSLKRITPFLKEKEFGKVLEDLKGSFDQWSGGTRIGTSLLDFVDHYGNMYLNHKTKVIILSDGWDTDKPEKVEYAMRSIKNKSSKVIWLNPLADNPNFKPEVACLKAAMPYIDIFQAANNIGALKNLITSL